VRHVDSGHLLQQLAREVLPGADARVRKRILAGARARERDEFLDRVRWNR
jgi:hypothetical protein